MPHSLATLLTGILERANQTDPTTALHGNNASAEEREHAAQIARVAHGLDLIENTGPTVIGVDFAQISVTADGRAYLAERGL